MLNIYIYICICILYDTIYLIHEHTLCNLLMVIEIVDLRRSKMLIFHSYVTAYQRVIKIISIDIHHFERSIIYTLWLFNIAMENGSFIDDFPS